jgi:hypothetical protein
LPSRADVRLTFRFHRHLLATRLNRSLFIPEHAGARIPPLPMRAWRLLRSARLFVVVGRSAPGSRFDARLTRQDCDGQVLMFTRDERVLHLRNTPIACSTEEHLRRRWARHVTSPGFVRSNCGHRIEEALLRGRFVSELDDDEQVRVIRRIFEMYRGLAHAEAGAPSTALRRELDGMTKCPLSVMSPSTASIDNILVIDGPEPAFIDVHPLVEMPFYAQPLRVLRNWERISDRPLMLVRAGVFDREVGDLLAAGGVQVPHNATPGEFFLGLPLATTPLPGTTPSDPS